MGNKKKTGERENRRGRYKTFASSNVDVGSHIDHRFVTGNDYNAGVEKQEEFGMKCRSVNDGKRVKRCFKEMFTGRVTKIWRRSKSMLNNEDGMGTIELVLLICVLIALALMFKDTIVEFVADILGNISSQETVFDPGAIAQ